MISDSHSDFITELKTQEEKEQYIKEINMQGVKNICAAVFTTTQKLILKDVACFAAEIDRLKTKYGVNLVFSIEDLGFLQLEEMEEFLNLKPFSVTLTWNYLNKFAGGAHTNNGLTYRGKQVVKHLEKNNILVDTAHMSRKSFWEFSKNTTKPIFNSHSNIYALHRHNRNLTDKQISKIVESNGFLGLTIYDEFVAGVGITSFDIAKQFDYLINKFGYLNFGFGTDFYGIDKQHLPKDIKDYKDLQIKVSYHLKCMGYNENIIDCLLYKNLNNFILRQQKTEH